MKIKSLHIKNFKSLVDLKIVEPNPFTVFVGANGVGKSNIFEALEFASYLYEWNTDSAVRLFGGNDSVLSRIISNKSELSKRRVEVGFRSTYTDFSFSSDNGFEPFSGKNLSVAKEEYILPFYNEFLDQFMVSFGRIFIKNVNLVRIREIADEKLSIDCSNLEKVLKRLLQNESKREEITEYLQLLVPGIEKVEILSSELSGTETLLVYEKGIKKPFNKELISDGTCNILCLITAVLQSDEPQFLCIEELENGLTPYVIEVLVEMFRSKCEENGHYIWLNTHSQTLVRLLKEKELILVDKVNGATKITQLKTGDFYGLSADEAWLTNALGAGLPW